MMTAVETDVRDIVDTVDDAPQVPPEQRQVVRCLASEILEQFAQTDGLDLAAFAAAGLRLQAGLARPETPARHCTCGCDCGAWLDETGIREHERRSEARETDHFERVAQVGSSIGECSSAIGQVVASAESAVRALLAPARRMLDAVLNCGIAQLVQPAVEVVIEALRCARETASDRNCVIKQCLEEVACRAGEASAEQPAPPADFTEWHKRSDVVSAPAASTTDRRCVSVNVDINPKVCLGALGVVGAAAAIGALGCITAAGCETAPAPQPEPTPAPEPAPEPAPTAEPARTTDGVIAPPPELAQVDEPAPPSGKLDHLDELGTLPAQADGGAPASQPAPEPWAMKKTGQW